MEIRKEIKYENKLKIRCGDNLYKRVKQENQFDKKVDLATLQLERLNEIKTGEQLQLI